MSRTALVPVVIVAAALLLSSCGSSSASESKPAATTDAPAAVGVTQSLTDGDARADVTVFDVGPVPDGVGLGLLGEGQQYVGVDAQVCGNFAGQVGAMDRWALTDASNARYEPTTENGKPPVYPYRPVPLAPGECVRGWVMFETVKDADLVSVRYSTGDGHLLRWAV